jgi:hypothetical protein
MIQNFGYQFVRETELTQAGCARSTHVMRRELCKVCASANSPTALTKTSHILAFSRREDDIAIVSVAAHQRYLPSFLEQSAMLFKQLKDEIRKGYEMGAFILGSCPWNSPDIVFDFRAPHSGYFARTLASQ